MQVTCDSANTVHINRVMTSLRSNPGKWADAFESLDGVSFGAAWDNTMNIVHEDASLYTSWSTRSDEVKKVASRSSGDYNAGAYYAAWPVILALIAYDNSAHLLESTPEEIKLLDALGHPYAILFLPAAIALPISMHLSVHNVL